MACFHRTSRKSRSPLFLLLHSQTASLRSVHVCFSQRSGLSPHALTRGTMSPHSLSLFFSLYSLSRDAMFHEAGLKPWEAREGRGSRGFQLRLSALPYSALPCPSWKRGASIGFGRPVIGICLYSCVHRRPCSNSSNSSNHPLDKSCLLYTST